MRIAVLGTGVVGRTLASRLDGLGHDVVIGTRDPADTMGRTEPGGFGTPPFPQWQDEHPDVRLLSFADADAVAELLFNATSGGSAMAALVAAGQSALAGKVLIDVSNPLDYSHIPHT
jgi:predicted dinucleotide-binding enzyme